MACPPAIRASSTAIEIATSRNNGTSATVRPGRISTAVCRCIRSDSAPVCTTLSIAAMAPVLDGGSGEGAARSPSETRSIT